MGKEIRLTLMLVWPLLFGLAMIMMGSGLQGTLLSLRADVEGFSLFTTGLLMSLYYFGFLIGCMIIPKIIDAVGYIRVFAAAASLGSTAILLNGLFSQPEIWALARVVSGISFAALYIVAESWLNGIATNKLRGQIFGAYIFVVQGGLFAGQFLIGLAPVTDMELFVLVSVLVSFSLLPITLASKVSLSDEPSEKLPIKILFKSSPLSLISVFCSGFTAATIFTLGPLYAKDIGLSNIEVAHFIAAFILGSAILPLIIGALSDHIDRRIALIGIGIGSFLSGVALFILHEPQLLAVFIFGGFVTSSYSVAIAYANDHLKSSQLVSATTSLIFLNAIGACFGPLCISALMQLGAPDYFFLALASSFLIMTSFGVYRAFARNANNVEKQGEFIVIPARASPGIMELQEDD